MTEQCDDLSIESSVVACDTPSETAMGDEDCESQSSECRNTCPCRGLHLRNVSLSAPARNYTAAVPEPGKTYMISQPCSSRVVTLIDGEVKVVPTKHAEGGFRWTCEEKDGWLGFRNPVSGTYIGHTGNEQLSAVATLHREYEYFTIRQNSEEGYLLLGLYRGNLRLVEARDDSEKLMARNNNRPTYPVPAEAVWEFLEEEAS